MKAWGEVHCLSPKTNRYKIYLNFKKLMQENANYVVVEADKNSVVNFYSTKTPQSLAWAKECSRQMKSMSGKEYNVLVKIDGQKELLEVKDYEHTLGGKTN
jgi:hypothetical protein